ncbi:Phage regulatory protein Rha [Franzmannia pantelleriensis]|uniref:Phage regulatory protein Rha n=1 Tax=Franzmannia pantelleriensis TaxID=48727 RepID=A0A1G9H5R6_9GAMM|nr:Rha family transcriptional regulator [Halomonas pantelleriensis]SDL08202.1 Phage regulatory protein Rha [Halomonas pantelleriensis]
MSNIATMASTNEPTMSSREIAEVVEKRHDNVKRTIEMLVTHGAIRKPQSEETEQINNLGLARKVHHYRVNQRDSYVIVAQLSPEFTARLVDRWQELERQVAQPQVPQSFAEALRLAADTQEQLEEEHEQRKLADARRDSLQRAVGRSPEAREVA